jgi:hypothetical protein
MSIMGVFSWTRLHRGQRKMNSSSAAVGLFLLVVCLAQGNSQVLSDTGSQQKNSEVKVPSSSSSSQQKQPPVKRTSSSASNPEDPSSTQPDPQQLNGKEANVLIMYTSMLFRISYQWDS